MSEHGYAKQKFFEAVYALVGSASTIDKRLTYAAGYLLVLQEKELPETLWEEFEALRHALTTTPLSTGTAGRPRISHGPAPAFQPRQISEDDARKLAIQILEMYTKLMGGL